MKKVTSTYSRNISFGDFTINNGETKIVEDNFEVPEEWKSHLHVVEQERIDMEAKVFTVKTGKNKIEKEVDE